MKKRAKSIRIVTTVLPNVLGQMDLLIDKGNYKDRSDIIRAGVRLLIAKEFPPYMRRQMDRIGGEQLMAEIGTEKVEDSNESEKIKARRHLSAKRARDEARDELRIEECIRIAEKLEGVIEDHNGVKMCRWKTYEVMNPHYVAVNPQGMSLEHLTPDLIKYQYSPSYEAVQTTLERIKDSKK